MQRFAFVIVALVLAGVVLAAATSDYRRPRPPDPAVAERPLLQGAGGFATSSSCRACHPHQYETWHGSYHRTMTQVVEPATVLADFDSVVLHDAASTYHLERRGDEFWVRTERAGADSLSTGFEQRILLSTGSHHQQLYWVNSGLGRSLELLPFAFLLEDRRWTPLGAIFLSPPRERPSPPGEWNFNCLRCHATHTRPRLDKREGLSDSHVLEFGISCAECHGRAAEHVRKNHDPRRRYTLRLQGKPDPTIVNPERLPQRRSAQVCGQCHSVSLRYPAELAHWNESGFHYQPGDDFEDMQLVVERERRARVLDEILAQQPHFLDTSFWSDGMVRVSGREYNGLIRTPCFQRGSMSCLSCHTMHEPPSDPRPRVAWAEDQLKLGMETNQACTQCHPPYLDETKLVAHTHHKPESTGSECANCHMPYTTWGLLKAIRSHEVDSPTVQASLATGRPNACNLCHLDKTLGWTARYLEDWYESEAPLLSAEEDSVAASILWLLRGDAGQRALMAWHMGWEPALAISQRAWLAPYLGQLLDDPYHAVRYTATRSLRRLPGYADLEYDYMGPSSAGASQRERVLAGWSGFPTADAVTRWALLLDDDGNLDAVRFDRYRRQRNDSPVLLAE